MKKHLFILIFLPLLGLTVCTTTQKGDLSSEAGYATPEEVGISSLSILQFIEALEKAQPDAIHSVMLRRHGHIVTQGWWAPYNPHSPHYLWSLSKSFASTAIGMAQDEGLLSIDDQVISFFPEEIPAEVSNNLKAMRIRNLLKMNSGHQWDTSQRIMGGDDWVKAFLALEVEHKPGTHFVYNSGATYMLSAIISKATGMSMLEFLTPRLFEHLGIENPSWQSDPNGINLGGWGLSVTTEDISRLGYLYLQNGEWEGRQLLSQGWVEEATGFQTSNGSNPESDWEQGYGYQFWQCRYGAYRGDGAFGQFCIVMPEQDVVLAITSGSDDMQGILNVVWEHLLPAMKEASLPPDDEGVRLLNEKLEALALSSVKGEEKSSMASEVTGKSYTMDENNLSIQTISFNFESPAPEITITTGRGDQTFKVGYQAVERGILAMPSTVSDKVAASGAWDGPDTYTVNVIYYETPQSMKFTFRFQDNKLTWDTELKASFGPRNPGQLIGSYQSLY